MINGETSGRSRGGDRVNAEAEHAEWFAVDWGTSRLRIWAMTAQGVLARTTSDHGMGGLHQGGFEPALLDLIGPWLAPGRTTPVIACGMVGAREGWVEAGYARAPCPPFGEAPPVCAPARDRRIEVHVIPGLMQERPRDVMRGEETLVAGVLAGRPDFDGVLCLPGTHTKWVRVSAGVVLHFTTFMTGELFGLLAERSVLRHTVGACGSDRAAFLEGANIGLTRPEEIAGRLFSLRADALIGPLAPESARARLSGLLVGMELAGTRRYWGEHETVIVGNTSLGAAYAEALRAPGHEPTTLDAEAMAITGLAHAYARLVAPEGS